MSSGNGTIGQASYARAINRTMPSSIVSNGGIRVYKDSYVKKEKKKMGWFRKKFNSWVRQAWDEAREESMVDTVVKADSSISGKSSVRFTIYPASGGFIIEHYKQDRYKDSDGPSLTIVNHGEDLGKAVEHVIALEALRA